METIYRNAMYFEIALIACLFVWALLKKKI